MRKVASLLALLALGACADQPQALHADRNGDGTIYLSPDCVAHIDEVRAMKIAVNKVPRDNPILHLKGQSNAGLWVFGMIFMRDDLADWQARDTEDHERCHEWTYRKTGSPVFHR